MALVLEQSAYEFRNLLLYGSNGAILGGLQLRTDRPYLTPKMLYRYCGMIFEFPNGAQWRIFRLNANNSVGRLLRQVDHNTVDPGNYIILDQNKGALAVSVTSDSAPRRVHSRSVGSSPITRDRNPLQKNFRDRLRERDRACAISGKHRQISYRPYAGLEAAHIFPVSRIGQWQAQNFRSHITDTRPPSAIGASGLYSPQNGLLLFVDIHEQFDYWEVGVDPDEGYKVVDFSDDQLRVGGRSLASSAFNSPNPNDRVSPELLRWHLRMCLLRNMKGNAGTPAWESDLGPDIMGAIMDEPDAGERMEVELFTRLGPLIA
ncbi:hypothetical protein PVAR5_8501 [Paecilomyces variotii No. 5]|uniref:HNH nuclease domain-containing protein n=1 Tax=Byssochlamys spectabilis (strain No. 5 / NBRC 109023) TaxID=1356009 RepID=V5FP08_BYSSN|nr:hypothetical protein PVAR5_8501 [Paecilomyces variotii No. 5]